MTIPDSTALAIRGLSACTVAPATHEMGFWTVTLGSALGASVGLFLALILIAGLGWILEQRKA